MSKKSLKKIIGAFTPNLGPKTAEDHPVEVSDAPGEKGVFVDHGAPAPRPGGSVVPVSEAHSVNQLKQARDYHAGRTDTFVDKKANRKARLHGKAMKAADKLLGQRGVKEEAEATDAPQLDEVSKRLLQRYSRKAVADKSKDRSKGVALAQDKLKEAEQLDELTGKGKIEDIAAHHGKQYKIHSKKSDSAYNAAHYGKKNKYDNLDKKERHDSAASMHYQQKRRAHSLATVRDFSRHTEKDLRGTAKKTHAVVRSDAKATVKHHKDVHEQHDLTEVSKLLMQRYSRLASKDKSKDRSKGVALAQDKIKEK